MTKPVTRRHLVVTLAAPAVLAVLVGCAATGGAVVSAEDDQAALLARSKAYWALIQKNDRVSAWAYEEMSKDPSATLEGYLKRGGITFDAVEVRGVRAIEGDRATVNVWMRYSLPLLRLKKQEAATEDEWRRIDGVWHHVQRRSVMFPTAQ
ncbi:hypothetical protein EXV95_20545 [Acidovorax sp. JMULE5]|uniref:hypothetical protein n=1 Tax=Acidovorax sp. JMULE5 TaxID=2518343 RepID=UPI00159FE684|nr:hypothetical protein [Acidovorax sp. JMULE5]QLA82814.1 hypothetical protein EXV95_20545 [Acidovorax sp. JMULE5]